ncbi:two-component system sensor histidine kinase NtrB [Paludibaculum fermentans]|uniref:two-component system sensor histidine kinase NtrB n=1 Tax=Paludibaculum fermentans TaxID=1473598 RepID=UPI003EBF1E69
MIVSLMALTLPSIPTPGQSMTAVSDLFERFHHSWIRLFVLSALLGVILTASVLTVFSYFSTRKRLARIQTTSRAILESLVGGVLTVDVAARITIINRAASKILELPSQAPYPDLATLAVRHPRLAEVIRQALQVNEYVQDDDVAFANSRGDRSILRTTVSAQVDESGRRVGLVVLVKDVTRIIALEKELRRRDRLVTAGTLAAGVAHEIRNPLSAIELNLRLLRDEVLSPGRSDLEEYFDVLFAETRRMNRITSSFLQLSRPEPITKMRVPIQEPLKQVIRLLESEATAKGVSFSLDLPGGGLEVLGDSTKLEQVCLNLLINSMQAMPQGGVIHISCSRTTSEAGDCVQIVVADQGVGVPKENMQRLFDPYFTTRPDGTGLGLAIADRIVSDHGGGIFVESTPGEGTTMTVRLPLATTLTPANGDNERHDR